MYSLEAMENMKGLRRLLDIMMSGVMVGVDIIMGIIETIDAYKNKKDWKEAGFGAVGGTLGNYLMK